ncbi:hypothetical protein mRhiFer1_009593 [Rhinolophus ferrumequinum]|uniref:Uncharacterized protein n=1 Tax=Rhinolophus ferrumequinum TaxID=59479 RepID=A0A7J7ZQK4_RHIFE|nr:hypothetical protein mRhiFer1_009593 [Rhinolophus ferrumequinum]
MPVFVSTVLQAELGCSAHPHLDITPSRSPLDKGNKRLLHVRLLLQGWCPDMCPKIYPKRVRKPTLGNGAYLLLACLTLWVDLRWLGLAFLSTPQVLPGDLEAKNKIMPFFSPVSLHCFASFFPLSVYYFLPILFLKQKLPP